MKELLVDGIACEDCFIEASIDTISHVPALDAAGTRTVTKHIQPLCRCKIIEITFPNRGVVGTTHGCYRRDSTTSTVKILKSVDCQ